MAMKMFNRKAKIETSEMITGGWLTNKLTGVSRHIDVISHLEARSQKKIDPQKGPAAALWDIVECGHAGTRSTSKAIALNLTYKEMCTEMLAVEKAAADGRVT